MKKGTLEGMWYIYYNILSKMVTIYSLPTLYNSILLKYNKNSNSVVIFSI